MKIYTAVAIVAALAVPAAGGQTASSGHADPAAPMRIGALNMEVAITNTQEGKQAANELNAKFSPRQTELQNLQKQIQDINTRLQTGSNTLSDDEKYRLSREIDSLNRQYQRKQQEARDDYQDAQQDLINQLGRKMMTVLDKYSKDNGLAVVLDTSSQQTPVIYEASTIDITQDIIKLYDQTYPVKTSASLPSKPSGTAARPQQ
ncbi:MAG TPA: OmpH family outer membrane protein [Candidatus Cybelea sp.]|nr:OmpH family outer membrane protein [Candidatus Cybelea sp.]